MNNPFTYTAREAAESGLMYYRARWYMPPIGRFLSEDKLPSRIRERGELHSYRYTANNPISWKDSLGLKRECVFASDYHFISAVSLLHYFLGHREILFNLLYFDATCDKCETPANPTIDMNLYIETYYENENLDRPLAAFRIAAPQDIQLEKEFAERHGPCDHSVRYGYSWQTRAAGYLPSGNITNDVLVLTAQLCYDCVKCQ